MTNRGHCLGIVLIDSGLGNKRLFLKKKLKVAMNKY